MTDKARPAGLPDSIKSSVARRPTVFTAQSKKFFYCRDAICEYVFNSGAVPLNPFRAFGYFLGDRVERSAVREANNNVLRLCDEVWVFGTTVANGVLFEIAFAHELGLPVKLFTVANRASDIRPAPVESLRFESELYHLGYTREHLRAMVAGHEPFFDRGLTLFDLDDLDGEQTPAIKDAG